MIRRPARIFMLALLWHSAAWSEVKLDGILAEDREKLEAKHPGFEKSNPSLGQIDEMVRLLMNDQNYSALDVVREGANTFTIKGVALRKLEKVVISGNRALDDTDILNALDLKPGTPFDQNKMSAGGEKLQELYGRRGYFNATFEFTYTEKDATSLVLELKIVENSPCRIEEIVFESPNADLVRRLRRELKGYRGDIFTEESVLELERDANEFLREKRYLNAKIEQKSASYNRAKTNARLVYIVKDVFRYEVVFKGEVSYSRADLLRALNLDEFDSGSVDPGADIVRLISNKYLENGFAFAKVTYNEKVDQLSYTRRIEVTIDEGPRVNLEGFDITGRISRAPRFYSDFVVNNSSDAVDDGFFVKSDIEVGLKNLITTLNNEGYLKARIQSVRYEMTKDRKNARVKLVLDEGPLTQLRGISFEGNNSFPQSQLISILKIKPNSPLKLNQLEESIGILIRFYQESGYIEMRIENQDDQLVQYDDKGAQANVNFKIFEGPRVEVANIVLEGNNFTKDFVLLKKLELSKGDVLTPIRLDEARKRLESLAIFARVELRTLEANSMVAKRTLIVSVTEANPGIFKIGFGVNNERQLTLRGFTGVSYNNIRGTARAVSAQVNIQNNVVDYKYPEYLASISYLEPFLLDSKFRGRAVFSREEKAEAFKESPGMTELQIRRTDLLAFTAERDITSQIRFAWTAWSLESLKYFDVRDKGPTYDNSQQLIATVGPILDLDFRDNPFLPTRGTFWRVEAEYSDPVIGSSDKINFVRTQATFSHYLRMGTPKLIWANSLRGGYGKNVSSETGSGIPDSYAFYLGGYTTLRGYSGSQEDRVPNKAEFDPERNNKLVIENETNYYLLKSEIRFPLYGIIGGVIFTDVGEVRVQGERFANPVKQTYGFGIRINTPVGPLSLDYGRKARFDRKVDESPDQIHLSIGTF